MFNKTIGYALRAVIYLAVKRNHDGNISLSEIAGSLKVPIHYIGKILQSLAKNGLILSFKGPNGGFKASEKTLEATVFDIIVAIDGAAPFTVCSLGLSTCNNEQPCPIHFDVVRQREEIKGNLSKRTILQLAETYETASIYTLS
ncbi:MAG: Rrf2 family transcriptional regulator [Bacteroidetes bacterium]|jgi:Rrf2 family protein|nr:Rrf2 family transcriptional regulator [Bacteroidota bacterium]